ncbi:MAG: phosphodiesterase [Hyphomicrobiales bacterium]
MTRILQLTDLHIIARGELAYGVVDTPTYLERAVKHIENLLPKIGGVDAIVITGDLTDRGLPSEYELLKSLMKPLDIPLSILPGNHDERAAMRDAYPDQPWCLTSEMLNSHLKVGGVHLLALDCVVAGKSHGFLNPQTEEWLRSHLAKLADQPVIIAMHQPPFLTGIDHMDAQPLRNPERLFEVVSVHKAAHMIVCGHVHRYMSCHHTWGPVMIGPSVAHAVSLDVSHNARPEFVMEPGGFLLHSYNDVLHQFTSQYVPVGPFEGPYPFFADS